MRALRWWPYVRGRWRLASLLVSGDLGGGRSVARDLIPTLRGEIVRGRLDVAVRIRRENRYLSPYVFGDHEPLTSRLFAALLHPGDVAVDVGANYGWFTALFAHAVGDAGRVIAFEPIQNFAAELYDTVRINDADSIVDIEECGLADREGQFVVYTFPGLPGGHASSTDLGRPDAVPHICRVSTLDLVLRALRVGPVDLLKVDVEGGEREVFLGAQEHLRGDPGPIVHFEVNQECLAARRLDAAQVFEPLRDVGYAHLWRIGPLASVGRRCMSRVGAPSERRDADYIAAKVGAVWRVEQALDELRRRSQLADEVRRVRLVALNRLRR